MIPLLARAWGNAVVLASLPGQRRVPWLPRERLDALRDARVRRMVRYAAATVPYYRDLFRERGIDPRELRTAADLDRLPLIDKQLIAAQPGRFRSTSRAGRTAVPFPTSGTTGVRVDIQHDVRSVLQNIALGEREREVMTALGGRRLGYREAYIEHPDSTTERVWSLYRRWTFIPIQPQRLRLAVTEPVDEVVRRLDEFGADLLFGYGSYLETFFRMLRARGVRLRLPKAVVYDSDAMTPGGRELIEQTFAVPVLSHYNAMESFKIGFTCRHRPSFHLHEDICDVKIVDATGRRLPDGERGEVVISNLLNRGTVLLNYRLGDLAAIDPSPCPCGRTLRALGRIEGRIADIVWLPDGTFVHPMAVWRLFKARPEVLQYQLLQRAPRRFALRLVLDDPGRFERVASDLVAGLAHLLGPAAVIEPELHSALETGTSGKFRPVVALPRERAMGA